MKVLIVDDEPYNVEILKNYFQSQEVYCCYGAKEAIKVGTDLEPDLLLIDLHLGSENGCDVIEALKSRFPRMKSIVVTGSASSLEIVEVKKSCDGFLAKPFTEDRLFEAVTDLFAPA